MAGNQQDADPLATPKLVAPKPKYDYDISTTLPSSSPPPSASSPFFSPLYAIPQRQTSPSPASQIIKPPSRASLRSPKPEQSKTPTPSDLSLFESHCKSSFGLIATLNPENEVELTSLISDLDISHEEKLDLESRQKLSQSFIDRVLSNCPPSHRATYNRIQSKVRQLYHSQKEIASQKALDELIKSTEPHSKLSNFSRNHLHSIPSRIERFNLLKEFISKHCSKNRVGIHPFLGSLKLLFNLQRRSSVSGGGGALGVIWRMDDAVLMETGGEIFMRDVVDLLKGVFGFTESTVNAPTSNSTLDEDPFKDHQNISQNSTSVDSVNKRSSLMGGPGTSAPGFSNTPPTYLRFWYLPKHLTNPELFYLAREIPKFVLSGKVGPKLRSVPDKELLSSHSPSRIEQGNPNNNGIYSLSSLDREYEHGTSTSTTGSSLHSGSRRNSKDPSFKDRADLPTGMVIRGDPILHRREKGWKGTLIQRFFVWSRSLFAD